MPTNTLRSPRFTSSSFYRSSVIGALALVLIGAMWSAAASPRQSTTMPDARARRTVLITGANRGIGLEFAKQYAAAGWSVIGTAREPDQAADLKAIGSAVRIVELDVASDKSVAAMTKTLGGQPIDLLINNAGISGGGGRSLNDLDVESFENVMQVNALGPVRVTRALLPNLRAGAGKMIVSISSGLGSIERNTGGGYYGYRESKAALNMFMRSLAAELKDDGFVCIPMSPGWVKTDMGGPNAQLSPEQSIAGMRKVIESLKPADSGKFWNHDGDVLPW